MKMTSGGQGSCEGGAAKGNVGRMRLPEAVTIFAPRTDYVTAARRSVAERNFASALDQTT